MIRYATLHDLGKLRAGTGLLRTKRYILKYFDPMEPLDRMTAEYVAWDREPKPEELVDSCLILETDKPLFEKVAVSSSLTMRTMCIQQMFDPREFYTWIDCCDDAGFHEEGFCHKKILLFLFWNLHRIKWDRRLFLECQPTYTGMRRR